MTPTTTGRPTGRPTGTAARRRPLPRVVAGAALLGLLLGACSTYGDPAPSGTTTSESPTSTGETPTDTTPTDTPSPTESPTDDASTPGDGGTEAPVPFPANTEPDTADPSADALLTVTDVRVARHEGFDRVVLEMDGKGTPGWRVEYVDEPQDDGSGNPVDVDGDAFLQVMISGSGYPMDTGVDEYAGPNLVEADGGVVEEVLLRGVFEGYTQAFLGVDDERRPFRVFALEDPVRVVVDVRDDG